MHISANHSNCGNFICTQQRFCPQIYERNTDFKTGHLCFHYHPYSIKLVSPNGIQLTVLLINKRAVHLLSVRGQYSLKNNAEATSGLKRSF